MTVEDGCITVYLILLTDQGHEVIGDEIIQEIRFQDEELAAHEFVAAAVFIIKAQSDDDRGSCPALLHLIPQFRTAAEAPYSIRQEQDRISLIRIIIRGQDDMAQKIKAGLIVKEFDLLNAVLYGLNLGRHEFPALIGHHAQVVIVYLPVDIPAWNGFICLVYHGIPEGNRIIIFLVSLDDRQPVVLDLLIQISAVPFLESGIILKLFMLLLPFSAAVI